MSRALAVGGRREAARGAGVDDRRRQRLPVAAELIKEATTMDSSDSCGRSGGRRSFMRVVSWTVLAAACNRAASVGGDRRSVPGEAIKIDDVQIRDVDSGISVHYSTRTSIRDCAAQAAEMPKVWDLVVKTGLGEAPVQRVVLFPEDTSGQSVWINPPERVRAVRNCSAMFDWCFSCSLNRTRRGSRRRRYERSRLPEGNSLRGVIACELL